VSDPAAAILVVDDNDDNRYTLTRRLRRQGYDDLTEASSGREALEQIARRPFDLVLLDVMMPEMNGYEVLERLKADDRLRHIPVIMISALSELDSVVRCIELGAEDYLPKPFNAVLLQARIGASLERKRLHDRERAHLAEIDRQRRRADELLHAMLPLANLDHLASTFEDITSTHGLEKIKTVGDAFMATANLLDRHADPVMASLRAAFALAQAAGSTPAGWQVRSGIHIGPVVAGVVGSRKFSFDLWGDTVNLAYRLSSLGDEPAIHLSAAAWARVADRASGSPLGELDLKGKGSVEVVRCLSIGS
jgi:adenylate cyclase